MNDTLNIDKPKILTEDYDKIFEYDIYIVLGQNYDGKFKYNIEDTKKISDKLKQNNIFDNLTFFLIYIYLKDKCYSK
jgi:hypothetical protein